MNAMLEKTNVESTFENQIVQTADNLIKECSKIRVRFSWFGTSARIDDEILSEMMGGETAQVIKDAVASHKRLLKSKHEALVTTKQAFQSIKDYVNAMTIPLVLLRQASSDDNSDTEHLRKDAGTRVIQKKDMSEFDDRMKYLISVLNTAVGKLQKAMPAIKKEDKERLDKVNKGLYNDNDYPSDVTKLVGVHYSFEPIGVDADWEKLCPEIYERERGAARKKFEMVVENAAVEFADRFVKYVKQVVDQVGNRVRLNPADGYEITQVIGPDEKKVPANIQEAEVLTKLTSEDDSDVPFGYVVCKLRLLKGKFAKGRSFECWMADPIKEKHFYDKLRPYETSERKKFYESTIEHLKSELETFINIGSMLGPYQSIVTDSVSKVKNLLTQASSSLNASEISEQLRTGQYFRNKMKTVLEGVANVVESKMTNTVKKRRKISSKLIGKVGTEEDE